MSTTSIISASGTIAPVVAGSVAPRADGPVPRRGGWTAPPAPTALPSMMLRSGPIVALRERDAIALGSLQERSYVTGDLLVTSRDLAGESWWVPAESVWVDSDAIGHPEHPRVTGLATATNRDQAVLTGLSDRLGWEAVLEFERGTDLPPALAVAEDVPDRVVVLDGRLGHDVPTVVVMGPDFVRWGAGSTWDGAVRRALYGDAGNPSVSAELRHISSVLGSRGLGVVAVDLDTPLLRRAGIVRCSVQLVASNGLGRSWYAVPVD